MNAGVSFVDALAGFWIRLQVMPSDLRELSCVALSLRVSGCKVERMGLVWELYTLLPRLRIFLSLSRAFALSLGLRFRLVVEHDIRDYIEFRRGLWGHAQYHLPSFSPLWFRRQRK